jgi:nucleoside-diphosphate-sugar epimerase
VKTVLVAGPRGVVGRAAIERFSTDPQCRIVGLSRRAPASDTGASFVPADLLDAKNLRTALAGIPDVTHVVYAALHEEGSVVKGWTESDHVRVNLAMLANLVDALEETAPSLRHIAIMHGGKAYGTHLGPVRKMPNKESDARAMSPNFYYDQEDFIRERQPGKAWSWTILRPPNVAGRTIGSPMNTILAVGVFAAISRHLGIPLRFPGGEGHLIQSCDARLLAQAIEWSGETDAAQNEIFNVANGDVFMWEHVFRRVAEIFAMPWEPPHSISLARTMPANAAVWDDLVRAHDLQPNRLADVVPSWDFPDWSLRYNTPPFPNFLSTIKIRQAGFAPCLDTEDVFASILRHFQAERILPS